jgi:cell division protein FtsB
MNGWIGLALSLTGVSFSLGALWIAYKLGRVSVLKEQAEANQKAVIEARAHEEQISKLPDSDIDNKLDKWVRKD